MEQALTLFGNVNSTRIAAVLFFFCLVSIGTEYVQQGMSCRCRFWTLSTTFQASAARQSKQQ